MLAPYACTLNPAYGAVTGDLTYRVRGNQDQAGRGHCVSAYPRLDYRGGKIGFSLPSDRGEGTWAKRGADLQVVACLGVTTEILGRTRPCLSWGG